ncbi:MAG: hypothetical protein JWO30_3377 [Fibrobacteres bacterium]|nr:hypothetical protein [Fibrobacterota bacterium]
MDEYSRAAAIQRVIEKVSIQTRDKIKTFHIGGHSPKEEYFTEDLILEFLQSKLWKTKVFPHSRQKEAKSGCDFELELWIGATVSGFRRYAVQAKILNHDTNVYESLKGRKNGTQIRKIKKWAKDHGAEAVYLFYNRIETIETWNCTQQVDIQQTGCVYSPADIVQKIRGRNPNVTFEKINKQKETKPFRCLLCCPALVGNLPLSENPGGPKYTGKIFADVPWFYKDNPDGTPMHPPSDASIGEYYHGSNIMNPKQVCIIDYGVIVE